MEKERELKLYVEKLKERIAKGIFCRNKPNARELPYRAVRASG